MMTTRVTVRFPNGLHIRPASKLVQLLGRFRAQVSLRLGNRITNARSLLGILLLAATMDAQLEVQASGADENAVIQATEAFFQACDEEACSTAPMEPSEQESSGYRIIPKDAGK